MAQQIAITIGINYYNHERSLQCAENDALAMEAYLREIDFSEVLRYSDSASDHAKKPGRTNLLRAINRISNQIRLSREDSFWFFFSGHGGRQRGLDYLLPTDGDPELLAETSISTDYIIRALTKCEAGNLLFILDSCRNKIPDYSRGSESPTAELAKQAGIITLFSCSPGEKSYELPNLKQGAFTYALLEALRGDCVPTQCNAQALSGYLKRRVPELSRQYGAQLPYVVAEPIEKAIQVLLPSTSTQTSQQERNPSESQVNIDRLKADAFLATRRKKFDQAERLWKRLNSLAIDPADRELAVEMIVEIAQERVKSESSESNRAESISIRDPYSPPPAIDQEAFMPPPLPPPPMPHEVASPGRSVDRIVRKKQLDLSSEREGISYARLKELLSQGQWKEADKETADRMCEVIGRQKEGWLDIEHIENFPCKDLRIIDRLWVEASDGKFGFSVQKKIWQECGSPTEYNNAWKTFGDRVGWRVKGNWIRYSDVTYDTTAPRGHLPGGSGGGVGGSFRVDGGLFCFSSLLSRPDL